MSKGTENETCTEGDGSTATSRTDHLKLGVTSTDNNVKQNQNDSLIFQKFLKTPKPPKHKW
jgi:hypothetical protein